MKNLCTAYRKAHNKVMGTAREQAIPREEAPVAENADDRRSCLLVCRDGRRGGAPAPARPRGSDEAKCWGLRGGTVQGGEQPSPGVSEVREDVHARNHTPGITPRRHLTGKDDFYCGIERKWEPFVKDRGIT